MPLYLSIVEYLTAHAGTLPSLAVRSAPSTAGRLQGKKADDQIITVRMYATLSLAGFGKQITETSEGLLLEHLHRAGSNPKYLGHVASSKWNDPKDDMITLIYTLSSPTAVDPK
jgi:hypothetical protein